MDTERPLSDAEQLLIDGFRRLNDAGRARLLEDVSIYGELEQYTRKLRLIDGGKHNADFFELGI